VQQTLMHEGAKMRKALTAFALAAALAVLVGPAVAQAQDYPPAGDSLTVSDSVVVPGQSLTVSGGGAGPGAKVDIFIYSERVLLASTNADSDGQYSASVTIPASIDPGTHVIRAISGGEILSAVEVTVAGSGGAAADSDGDLPFTGAGTLPGIGIGVGLIALGSTLLLASRRRRSQRAPETVA
jgi:hypothetical protein